MADEAKTENGECVTCRLPLGRKPVVRETDGEIRRFCCSACASTDHLIRLLRRRDAESRGEQNVA